MTAQPVDACLRLAACPFCGGEAEVDSYDHCAGTFVQCCECFARVSGDGSAWNRRVPALQGAMQGWIPVSERLPEIDEPVVLIDMNRWENTANPTHERNVQDCGYLSGQRGSDLTAYTHWRSISPPTAAEPGEA
jgi:uncharacterized protein DUF551